MEPTPPPKKFILLFVLCLILGLLPIAPGQHFHVFIVPAFFYYCATHRFPMQRVLFSVIAIAAAEFLILYYYYQDSEIDAALKQLLVWEKPSFILLFTAVVFILIDKITISISSMTLLSTVTMLVHTGLTMLLLKLQGNYSYVEFVFTQIDTTAFYERLTQNLPPESYEMAKKVVDWSLTQLGTFNIISNLIYAVILSCLFYKRVVGIRNEVFLGFRLPRFVGFFFLAMWTLALTLFFSNPLAGLIQTHTLTEFSSGAGTPTSAPLTILFHVTVSILMIFSTLYSFQGLSCLAFFFKALIILRNRLSLVNILALIGCILLLIFIFSLERVLLSGFLIFFLLGFVDQWRDFRGFNHS